jgi:hypothetical protein
MGEVKGASWTREKSVCVWPLAATIIDNTSNVPAAKQFLFVRTEVTP